MCAGYLQGGCNGAMDWAESGGDGADIGGLISMIMKAALTARQNRRECDQLARRILMIRELLPHLQLQDPRAIDHLAQTAACCVQMEGKERPDISDVVASLEMALELIGNDGTDQPVN